MLHGDGYDVMWMRSGASGIPDGVVTRDAHQEKMVKKYPDISCFSAFPKSGCHGKESGGLPMMGSETGGFMIRVKDSRKPTT
jgi:hypothetical protein